MHGPEIIVIALVKFASADVTNALLMGRVEFEMEGSLADVADHTAGNTSNDLFVRNMDIENAGKFSFHRMDHIGQIVCLMKISWKTVEDESIRCIWLLQSLTKVFS